jgi:L-ascorbate metabolism protein UlaG (beta-lactamase superfamily)
VILTRGNKITCLGHAAFRIVTPSGEVILIDPWLSTNPKCPEKLKSFGRVDTILLTHGHDDHLGDTLELAGKHHSQVLAIHETALWLESKGLAAGKVQGMGKGGTAKVGDIEVTLVNAIHSNSIHDGDKIVYGGEPAGLIVRLPGDFTIYHAGDTDVFGDMKIIAELYSPDLVILPVGDHYAMGPRQAALAIRLLGAHHVVPMHYGTFPALTGTPEALREFTRDVAGLEIHAMKPGETLG